MSKMSQLHAELSEQAYELGFEDLGEAEQAGYVVDWENRKLVDGRELAHKEWLKEKEEVLRELSLTRDYMVSVAGKVPYQARYIDHAIEFVKKGEV